MVDELERFEDFVKFAIGEERSAAGGDHDHRPDLTSGLITTCAVNA